MHYAFSLGLLLSNVCIFFHNCQVFAILRGGKYLLAIKKLCTLLLFVITTILSHTFCTYVYVAESKEKEQDFFHIVILSLIQILYKFLEGKILYFYPFGKLSGFFQFNFFSFKILLVHFKNIVSSVIDFKMAM